MDLQEKTSEEKQNEQSPKFKTFIKSFITDTLVFSGALLTVIVTSVVIYMISGQSKLKMLVASIALQHIRAIEAFNPKYQDVHCDFGMLKCIMILILVVVMILAFGKLRIFRGQLISNMVKIKLYSRCPILCAHGVEYNSWKCGSVQINRCTTFGEY